MSVLTHKIYIVLAFVILIFSLPSCRGGHVNTGMQASGKSVSTEADSSAIKGGASWTTDTSPVCLDWYINAGWYDKVWDAKNTLYDKTVTELTGVDLNIIIPSSSGTEKLIAMASSGDLPDLITIDNWNDMSGQLLKAGIFQPLNKLAEKYAPELTEIIPESMKKWLAQEDGSWYAVTNYFTAPEWAEGEVSIENPNGVVARGDIMSMLGIRPEDFVTQDGTVAALKKVKEADIKYNGKKIIPFYFQWNDWAMSRMWGIPWEDKDGSWISYITHPKYVEIYKFLNRLWREELLSRDNFTLWAGEKIQQGLCFAYMGNLDDIRTPLFEISRRDNLVYVPVGPIHANDGAKPVFDQAGTGWMSTSITNKCKYPDRAVRLLAFLSGNEGQMLTWYGVEGKTYEVVDGKVRYTKEYIKMRDEDPDMAKKVYGVDTFWPLKQNQFNTKHIDTQALPRSEKEYYSLVSFFSRFSAVTPETMGVGPEQQTPEAAIKMRIEEYWSEQTRRMVMAKSSEEVDRIYNEALRHIQSLKYSRLYEVSDARFQMQKEKMAKKFSFPGNAE